MGQIKVKSAKLKSQSMLDGKAGTIAGMVLSKVIEKAVEKTIDHAAVADPVPAIPARKGGKKWF